MSLLRAKEEDSLLQVQREQQFPKETGPDDQNGGFRMSSIVGKDGIAVNQALVGRVKPWFERFGIL